MATQPSSLGYPSINAQSSYYPGTEPISQEEVTKVSDVMKKHTIEPENTRIQKVLQNGKRIYHLLQASEENDPPPDAGNDLKELAKDIFLIRGDHCQELSKVCSALEKAKEYATDPKKTEFLTHYITHFRTGRLEAFWESQKVWVEDRSARVENLIGFIESYRDPAGIRSEWEAMVGIADPDETSKLKRFVESSTDFIRQLPWAVEGVNDGKGPFENNQFQAPDFTSVHGKSLTSHYTYIYIHTCADLPSAGCMWQRGLRSG